MQGFKDYFGEHTLLSNIHYVDVETYQNKLRDKLTMIGGRIRKPSSINREMTVLGGMFNKAVEWEMMEKSPLDKGKKLHLKENNERKLYLTRKQVAKLLSECHAPHVRGIVFTALNTGMRLKEILTLQWSQIRDRRIYIMDSKTMAQGVPPLNKDMLAILREIRREQELTSSYVFTYQGKKIDSIKVGFNAACRRAGITGFPLAIEAGKTAVDVMVDGPFSVQTATGTWTPANYDNKYMGHVTLMTALAYSLNTISVQIATQVGLDRIIEILRGFGVQSPIPRHISIALGTPDLTPLEIAAGIAGVANGGRRVTPRFFDLVTNTSAEVVDDLRTAPPGPQIISPEVAYVVINMLKQVVARGTARYAGTIGRPAFSLRTWARTTLAYPT